jgi:hypothetical protein
MIKSYVNIGDCSPWISSAVSYLIVKFDKDFITGDVRKEGYVSMVRPQSECNFKQQPAHAEN